MTLICDQDRRGYNFNSKDKVEVLSIDYDKLEIKYTLHSYKLLENVIFIQQSLKSMNNKNYTKPIGWIFRRSLDYVSLDYINGDWIRKFLWSCEITSYKELQLRIKYEIDKLIKSREN